MLTVAGNVHARGLGGEVDRRGDTVQPVQLLLDPDRARRAGHPPDRQLRAAYLAGRALTRDCAHRYITPSPVLTGRPRSVREMCRTGGGSRPSPVYRPTARTARRALSNRRRAGSRRPLGLGRDSAGTGQKGPSSCAVGHEQRQPPPRPLRQPGDQRGPHGSACAALSVRAAVLTVRQDGYGEVDLSRSELGPRPSGRQGRTFRRCPAYVSRRAGHACVPGSGADGRNRGAGLLAGGTFFPASAGPARS